MLGVRDTVAPIRNRMFGTITPWGCKPTNVNIEITNRCCLRCQICDIWKSDGENELSVSEWKKVVSTLKDWLGSFRLTITGGEPFMKRGIWNFLEHCIGLDLPVVVITNGFCFSSKQLSRLLKLRLTQIVISLDSLSPETHDKVRGIEGAFEKTRDAICFLSTHKRPFMLASNTVIMSDNILELGNLAHELRDIGVDRIFFQPVQGGFTNREGLNWPYDYPVWPSSEHVEEGIISLLEAKQLGAPVVNSVEEIIHFKEYFLAGSNWNRPWSCPVGYTTFHCDAYGHVRMCVPYAGNIGNVRTHHPAEIWQSELANHERELILACKKACMLSCTRKYSVNEKMNYAKNLIRLYL